jgi:hypothetical protein
LPKLLGYTAVVSASLSTLIWIYVFIKNPLKSSTDADCSNTDCVQGFLGEVGLFGLLMFFATILLVVAVLTYIFSRKLTPHHKQAKSTQKF